MIIIESSKYKKSYTKLLVNKNKEKERIELIKALLNKSNNLHSVLVDPFGSYPYNTMEITDIEFIDIDNKHYGEG